MPERSSERRTIRLECQPTAPGVARRFARTVSPPGTTSAIELVVSELVTNAVVHARSEVELSIRELSDCVRIEVHDRSHRLPHVLDAELGVHGRGLLLVHALSARWGSEQTRRGKTVWCEVQPADSPLGRRTPTAC